jgi:signal peptidase I
MTRRTIVHVTVAFVLTTVGVLAAFTLVPRLWGWEPLVITSGSMTPMIATGDVVVIAPADHPLPVGAVVTYRERGSGQLVTHRVAGLDPDGSYVTKGDANRQPDAAPVPRNAVVGEVRLLVPAAGWPVTADRRIVVLVLVLIVTAAAAGGRTRRYRPRHSSGAARPGR